MEGISRADEVEIEVDDPGSEAARFCLASYFDELEHRFEGGVDVSVSLDPDATTFTEPSGVFLVARLGDQPVGCTAMKFGPGERAMIKRMWVSGEVRGMGLGRKLLAEAERLASDRGVRTLRLETNRTLTEAMSLYRSSGFEEVDPFNDEPYAHHWFEKLI